MSQYLPGASSILEQVDSRLLILLRDGKNLIGTLRTFDQYLNLVLENTVERVIYKGNCRSHEFIISLIILNPI